MGINSIFDEVNMIKKGLLLLLVFNLFVTLDVYATAIAYRIHNYKGERVGTCKHDPWKPVYYLYDMNGEKVKNPAAFMGEPENDCYLFDVDGIAIGKCSSKRVIIWGR